MVVRRCCHCKVRACGTARGYLDFPIHEVEGADCCERPIEDKARMSRGKTMACSSPLLTKSIILSESTAVIG